MRSRADHDRSPRRSSARGDDRDDAARIRDARSRLLRELGAIAAAVPDPPTRCPYRDARDRCTFHGGCRNQRPAIHHVGPPGTAAGPPAPAHEAVREHDPARDHAPGPVAWRCSGAELRSRPAAGGPGGRP